MPSFDLVVVRGALATAIAFACLPACAQAVAGGASAPAGKTTDPTQHARPKTLQTMVVTGTRVFTRSAVQSLAPIDVLTPQELRSTGAPDLTAALRALLPSINFSQPSNVDATEAVRSVQLRGLSPDEVLVLIDGKRQHTTSTLNVDGETYASGTAGVDLNAIPMNAIERIEVLRDGAAAQYGSDAIAGVVNIILKGGARHGEVSVTHGQYSAGDGATWQGGADGGFDLGQKGWVHLTANYQLQDRTNRAGIDPRFPADPTYDTVTMHDGLPLSISKQAAANFQYDLAPHAQVYGFFLFSKRNVSGNGYFRSLSTYEDSTPAAVAVYPDGFLPRENSALLDTSAVVGVRGTTFGGWHYDISANDGANHWKLHTADTFNYSLGAASPTSFYIGTTTLRDQILSADFSNSFTPVWLANPLHVAWGVAYRDEIYQLKAGDPASYFGAGAQVFPGFQPGDAGAHTRQNLAGYVELQTNLTDKLSADIAARYEHYSDFGRALPLKLSGRYQFNDAWAVRGTASTGFRAPSLQQSWYSSTSLNSFIDPVTGAQYLATEHTFPVSNPAAVALGAKPLQPEKSLSYSLGLVYTPASGFFATLDLYQISISNRIVLSGFLSGPQVEAFLTSVGIPFVAGGEFFTNAVSTRTRGADLVVGYPLQLANGGTLKLSGGFDYNHSFITRVAPNPPQLGLAGLVLPVFPEGSRETLVEDSPKSKVFASADWQRGAWRLHGQLTRYGEFGYNLSANAAPQRYRASYVVDASASYLWRQWMFTLGADDLTDAYPEKNDATNDFYGMFVYPHSSPIGDGGAYFYARATYRW